MTILVLILLFAALAVLAPLYGVDSRDLDDRRCRS
jgi:hypothetical protein